MSSSFVISAIKKAFPECVLAHLRLIRQQWRERAAQKELECVRQILSRSGKNLPQTKKESEIQSLLEEFSPLPAYGYDDASLWLRACERTSEILKIPGMNVPGKTVLELGCGDGLTGWMLSLFGHRTILCDQEDWLEANQSEVVFMNWYFNDRERRDFSQDQVWNDPTIEERRPSPSGGTRLRGQD